MDKLINETRVLLIGGSSHVGKSTLAQSLAAKLDWNYLSTDNLARHPGRPWANADQKPVREHVVEHYKTLSVNALFFDVLSHYEQNVLPQVEAIVHSHLSDLLTECLIIEGSALWPGLVADLVSENNIKIQAIWLTASDRFLQNRIYQESNFNQIAEDEKYLIQKFLNRTLFYNKRMKQEVKRLRFICIDVEFMSTADELLKECLANKR